MVPRALLAGTFDLRTCCNGLLSGLVAGTALVGFCSPWAALVAGVLAGLLYVCSSRLLVRDVGGILFSSSQSEPKASQLMRLSIWLDRVTDRTCSL
jgi:hypothetical protein